VYAARGEKACGEFRAAGRVTPLEQIVAHALQRSALSDADVLERSATSDAGRRPAADALRPARP
jgi:hypothetical protein